MPSISTSSANFSGVHLKQNLTRAEGSRLTMQNIFFAMRNSRLFSHWTSSVACGSERQNSLIRSMWDDMAVTINCCAVQSERSVFFRQLGRGFRVLDHARKEIILFGAGFAL